MARAASSFISKPSLCSAVVHSSNEMVALKNQVAALEQNNSDLGAQIAQYHTAGWAHDHVGKLYDSHAVQWQAFCINHL